MGRCKGKKQRRNLEEMNIVETKGITLTALVVTIVVLIILVGITINTLFSEDGVINKAIQAKEITKKTEVIESIQSDIIGKQTLKMGENITQAEFEEILIKYAEGGAGGIIKDSDGNITGIKVEDVSEIIPIEEIYDTSKLASADGSTGEGSGGQEVPKGPNGKPLVTTVTTTEHTGNVYAEDTLGNPVTIPTGFKIAADSGATVPEGIVIEDGDITAEDTASGITRGNQFVWIPVSNIDGGTDTTKNKPIKLADGTEAEITLGRYTFSTSSPGTETKVQYGSEYAATTLEKVSAGNVTNYKIGSYYYELNEQRVSNQSSGTSGTNTTAKNLQAFVESVESNHGYYIARYEASYGSGSSVSNYKPLSKVSTANSTSSMNYTRGTLWHSITQGNAATVARNMYAENKDANGNTVGVESDLINSYAWDTAIVYIQKMGNTNYANATRGSNTSLMNTGSTGDVKCKIYDMAGNENEWTTEYSAYSNSGVVGPCVSRGGYYNNDRYTAYRDFNYAAGGSNGISFRVALYAK